MALLLGVLMLASRGAVVLAALPQPGLHRRRAGGRPHRSDLREDLRQRRGGAGGQQPARESRRSAGAHRSARLPGQGGPGPRRAGAGPEPGASRGGRCAADRETTTRAPPALGATRHRRGRTTAAPVLRPNRRPLRIRGGASQYGAAQATNTARRPTWNACGRWPRRRRSRSSSSTPTSPPRTWPTRS